MSCPRTGVDLIEWHRVAGHQHDIPATGRVERHEKCDHRRAQVEQRPQAARIDGDGARALRADDRELELPETSLGDVDVQEDHAGHGHEGDCAKCETGVQRLQEYLLIAHFEEPQPVGV